MAEAYRLLCQLERVGVSFRTRASVVSLAVVDLTCSRIRENSLSLPSSHDFGDTIRALWRNETK